MPSSVTAQYAAGVAAGRIERDEAQLAVVAKLARLEVAYRRISAGAKIVVARLAVRRPRSAMASDQGSLHLRRRRARQDDADGPVFRGQPGRASAARIFTNSCSTCTSAFTPSPEDESLASTPARIRFAGRRELIEGSLAALLRRISCHRHRRRHDPRPAVCAIVRTRRRGRRDLERGAERALQGRLNRALFVPFIQMLEEHMDVVRLDARTDFRLEKLAGKPVWYVPADDGGRGARRCLAAARRRP
jgi:hypothetical protein